MPPSRAASPSVAIGRTPSATAALPLGGALAAEAAALVAAALADPDLVALALEPRGPLAEPVPAVGALGHVRADLGAAAPADDAQLRCL